MSEHIANNEEIAGRLDLPPPSEMADVPRLDVDMAMVLGTRALVQQRKEQREAFDAAYKLAEDAFREVGESISERALIRSLVMAGCTQTDAAAAVDKLEATGKAVKDWSTGVLRHA